MFSPKDEPETSPVSVQTNSPYSVAGSGTGSSDGQDYPDSPATPTGSIEKKRKHRPGPLNLMIPSQSGMGSHNALLSPPGGGFASRLRSPRLSGDKSSLTPPPYTPPPMLSPSRRGSGLFWNVVNTASSGTTTPHSASRFLLKRSKLILGAAKKFSCFGKLREHHNYIKFSNLQLTREKVSCLQDRISVAASAAVFGVQ